MANETTKGMGQQNGTARNESGDISEVTGWEFEPAQTLGSVVSNATGGFQGQIYGSVSGKGKVTVLVPAGADSAPMNFGADTVLNLYADANQDHGFENINAAIESTPVAIDLSSDKGIEITYNFKSNGPFDTIGAFDVLGDYDPSSPPE